MQDNDNTLNNIPPGIQISQGSMHFISSEI